ncbi:MAG: hypothetical protein GY754_30860 [bacterium]|nr:hypothetical protein [bacterium]
MKKLIYFVLPLILLASCATLKQTDLPAHAGRVDFEPQQVKLDYDVFFLRIDLFRQTTMRSNTQTHLDGNDTVPKPYHYIGVDIGNGIFFDANMNLSLDLLKLMQVDKNKDFKVIEKGDGILSSDTEWIKNGSDATIDYGGFWGSEIEIEVKENGAVVKGYQEIVVEPNKISYYPYGISSSGSKSTIVGTPAGAQISDLKISKNEDGSLNLGKDLIVRNEGKKIIFKLSRWLGSDMEYVLIRDKNRIIFYDPKNFKGIKIDIIANKVLVTYAQGDMTSDTVEYQVVR